MTSVVLGVAIRALVNVLCSQNEKFAASALGLWDGFSLYQAHLDNSLLDIATLLQLAIGLVFDFTFFGSIVRTITYALGCFLGILVGDFGPDLWYEFGGEGVAKELNTFWSLFSLGGGDGGRKHRRHRPRSSSPTTSVRKSEGETTVRGGASTSRRRRSTRRNDDQSTVLTRDSRVTFDETSITQSQTEDSSLDDGTEVQGLYMEPSTAASHLGVRSPAHSLFRRMYDDDDESTQVRRLPLSSISRSGGDTTPRGTTVGLEKMGENAYPNLAMPSPSPVARVDDVLGSLNSMPEPMIFPVNTDGDPASGAQTSQDAAENGESSVPNPYLNDEMPPPSPVANVDDVLEPEDPPPEPMIIPVNPEGDPASDNDNWNEATIDVRGLPREVATERIERRWKVVRKKGGHKLTIRVPDEGDGVSDASDHPAFFKFRLLDHMKRQGFDARFDTHTPGVVTVTALFTRR